MGMVFVTPLRRVIPGTHVQFRRGCPRIKNINSCCLRIYRSLFIAVVLFTACNYRRENDKRQPDNDEMSKIDSALDGNSNDTSLPPRSREVILTSPVTVH